MIRLEFRDPPFGKIRPRHVLLEQVLLLSQLLVASTNIFAEFLNFGL
jgi:hypothetical protein